MSYLGFYFRNDASLRVSIKELKHLRILKMKFNFTHINDAFLALRYQAMYNLIEQNKPLKPFAVNKEIKQVRKLLNQQLNQAKAVGKGTIGSELKAIRMTDLNGLEIGFCVYSTVIEKKFGILRGLVIHDKFRGNKLSSLLVSEFEKYFQCQFIEVLHRDLTWATPFYRQMGYKKRAMGVFSNNMMFAKNISDFDDFRKELGGSTEIVQDKQMVDYINQHFG